MDPWVNHLFNVGVLWWKDNRLYIDIDRMLEEWEINPPYVGTIQRAVNYILETLEFDDNPFPFLTYSLEGLWSQRGYRGRSRP